MDNILIDQVIDDTMILERIPAGKRAAFAARFLEQLDVVDDCGRVVGRSARGLVHRLGLRHRTVFVLAVSPAMEILLQMRGGGAASSQHRLDIGVGGHVRAGELDLRVSAIRETREELGMEPDRSRLTLIGEYNRDSPLSIDRPHERNRERRTLFVYALDGEETASLQRRFEQRESRGEVAGYGWFSADEVISAIDAGRVADGLPSNFMHWLLSSASTTGRAERCITKPLDL